LHGTIYVAQRGQAAVRVQATRPQPPQAAAPDGHARARWAEAPGGRGGMAGEVLRLAQTRDVADVVQWLLCLLPT